MGLRRRCGFVGMVVLDPRHFDGGTRSALFFIFSIYLPRQTVDKTLATQTMPKAARCSKGELVEIMLILFLGALIHMTKAELRKSRVGTRAAVS
jgi:hypothetical protein